MEKKTLVILILIATAAAFLRFYRLGEIPTGLHRDEAFLGYNAYSILKTGRDMSGNKWPLNLQSFLYSPAGYSYFSIPFIAIFNLNTFSVRLASALFGTMTIITTFLLSQKFFGKKWLSLSASFLLALSPWHINLSRTATENVIVVFFISVGVLFYLRWKDRPSPLTIVLAILAFVITLTLYQAPRAFLPIFLPFMAMALGVPKKHRLTLAIIYFIAIIVPLIFIMTSPQLSLRIRTVSILADTGPRLSLDEQIREDGVSGIKKVVTRIFHNKAVGYTNEFLNNYFSHFTYGFLFTDKSFPDRYRIPDSGLLYLFELPLLLIGTYFLWSRKKQVAILLLGWIAIAPVGSALTFDDVPNLQRTLLVSPALSLLAGYGVYALVSFTFAKQFYNWLLVASKFCLATMAIFNVSFYLHQYYVHEPVHRPWFRHEGYQKLVTEVNALLPRYNKAVITTRESAPTIFFLFFSKYDPKKFQLETYSPVPKDLDRINFNHYEFSQEECPLRLEQRIDPVTGRQISRFIGEPNVIYVNFGTCKTPSDYALDLGEIKRGDNSVVFKLTTTK